MRVSAFVSVVILLAVALSASPAMAAHMASATIGYYGVYYPVVGGGAIFTLTVRNSAASTHAINKVVLDFESSGFKVVWANGAGWSASNTATTCTFEAGAQPPITPGSAKAFSTKVTLPWTVAQYDFLVTTTDSAAASASFRTSNKVNVSYASCGNADAVDLFHANATPTANMLLPLGGDAKYDGAVLRDGTVLGSALADLAVSTAKLGDAAVTSDKLGPASVGALHLIDGAVTEAKIADAAVTTGKLADGGVTSPKIAAGSVTNTHLAADSVTTANIQGDAVADDKIPDLWRTVNLPIMGSQLMNGAVVSPDSTWAGVDFPPPAGPVSPQISFTIEMPSDWDPIADPAPYVELLWFADDTPANRGKTVLWFEWYQRQVVGQPYAPALVGHGAHVNTDATNASIIRTTDASNIMNDPSGQPIAPNDLVHFVIARTPVWVGQELPANAHLVAARLWYLAKR
jgi:hypothetical protein